MTSLRSGVKLGLMKKLSLYIFLVLMFSLFTSSSFSATKHKIYKKLPCKFNGVKVGPSARLHDGVKGGRCCPTCSAYKKKRGTSMEMRRGTPIVAIADMKLIEIIDFSAEQKSRKFAISMGKKHGKDHYQSQNIMKPFDDIRMSFIDKKGNVIVNYHLKETNLVKGFNKGDCKIPREYQWGGKSNLPRDCGGYSKELIKNNFWVKKGQVIGLSGQTGTTKGGGHISLGIAIPPDEGFGNYLIEMTKDLNLLEIETEPYKIEKIRQNPDGSLYIHVYNVKQVLNDAPLGIDFNKVCPSPSCALIGRHFINELLRDPSDFTRSGRGGMRYTAPQRDFKWENLPTDSDAYLFPVMSKKYLKEIGYYK